jgi:hypothetical protein
MIYSAKIENTGKDVEEEVSVLVEGVQLTCFASCCPYEIEIGKVYQVDLIPMVFDDYIVQEVDDLNTSIQRIGDTYSYLVIGKLLDGKLSCGSISFFDEEFLSRFGFLDGKMVSWVIDRLDISFE